MEEMRIDLTKALNDGQEITCELDWGKITKDKAELANRLTVMAGGFAKITSELIHQAVAFRLMAEVDKVCEIETAETEAQPLDDGAEKDSE